MQLSYASCNANLTVHQYVLVALEDALEDTSLELAEMMTLEEAIWWTAHPSHSRHNSCSYAAVLHCLLQTLQTLILSQ